MESVDPRIRRTRRLLCDALEKLLKKKEFDQISVQDIAAEATVNRATFYDHYNDKSELLQCMVGRQFEELLEERQAVFDGQCGTALKSIVLALGDYIGKVREFRPHLEAALIAVLRRILLDGLHNCGCRAGTTPEMVAAAAAWAIYGAAKEWVQVKDRCPSEEMAEAVVGLVSPVLSGG